MFERIGLIAKSGATEIRDTLTYLVQYLQEQQRTLVLDECCTEILGRSDLRTIPAAEIGAHCDLAITIGGDGTMLKAAHKLSGYDVPLLGINLGRLGFLADVPADSIAEHLGPILKGEFDSDSRAILQGAVSRRGSVVHNCEAINDIIIQKWNTARLIEFDTHIDGHLVNCQRADGLIIATPTGSTAYAMSSGGPILHPAVDAIALVPISPHNLSNRPIVVSGNAQIEVTIISQAADQARLSADGDTLIELQAGDRVLVNRMERAIQFIHPAEHEHFRVLRTKLHWGRELC
ncbi:MAG: NAD(+) kinase [Gammaproteobacteria bacterium]